MLLATARLVFESVHLVRRRREQEDERVFRPIRALVIEEGASQLRPEVFTVEEILEPLELVENDEIGFERVNADASEHLAQVSDHRRPPAVFLLAKHGATAQFFSKTTEGLPRVSAGCKRLS